MSMCSELEYPVTLFEYNEYNEDDSVESAVQADTGSTESASQVQDSFHESDADADTTSKAATDPLEGEKLTTRSLEKRARRQEQMFDAYEQFLSDEDIDFDAYG